MRFSGLSSPNYLFGRIGSSGINPFKQYFAPLKQPLCPRESLELKKEAKEPSMEEAKRCELKLHVEIKRTARIRCGGRVPTGAIAPRNSVKKENIPPPVSRSAHIRGMKRKDYKEASPEPKDYGGSNYSVDRSPSSWAAAGRDDNDLYIWDEEPKRGPPKAPTAAATTATTAATMDVATTAVMMVETMVMKTPLDYI
jgi:hypothetical protein